ncbi:MAG: TPMT family class I SAM-dependent methyltransferase [Cryomorphaceae bacterium]|jgi:thiopurine S-methyltransferase|nr:TPMT family class I SAM-dependent methyltransferase [Cryomorphaceae bacterium]
MANELSSEYWQKRYVEGQTGWDVGTVSTPLKSYIDQLTDTQIKILIPGCGFGHEGKYLYEKGFRNVYLLDYSEHPISYLRSVLTELDETHFMVEDFFSHVGRYDLILEQTMFCAIDPSLRTAYVEKVYDLLNTGGKLAGVLFNKQFEGGPPFGGSAQEYKTLFSMHFSNVSIQPCYNSIEPRLGNEVFIQAIK